MSQRQNGKCAAIARQRIVDGIEAGDPTAAAAATRSHLREIIISLPDIAARFPDVFDAAG